jgi:peptidoglycan hydrolase-like protein with peptidoglycan-binding domain
MRHRVLLAVAASALLPAAVAGATISDRQRPDPNVAGLQTALAVRGFYHGSIDGIRGPQTNAALRAFRRSVRLASLDVVDRRTLSALGMLGRPRYGSRVLRRGMVGLDVAALQFELRYHGFPNAERGTFGRRTLNALRRFQTYARLHADGVAGRSTYVALALPPPATPKLRPPLGSVQRTTPVGNAVELSCPYATPVAAVLGGTVVFAANRPKGYGYTVITRDARRLEVVYAHLARIDVSKGDRLVPGALVGLAGWTGKKRAETSLRLELRVRGAQLDAYDALR